MRVLIPLPSSDFDPTEASVPWRALTGAGHSVAFATPDGRPGQADPRMVTGAGFGLIRRSLMADPTGVACYREMERSAEFRAPLRWDEVRGVDFGAIVLPGGHAPGMRPYLESEVLQALVGSFADSGRPVAAICHGVVLAARSRSSSSRGGGGASILRGKRATALPAFMELTAWWLTRAWLGSYYRTYPQTVEAEVKEALGDPARFERGPLGFARDTPSHPERGFIVRDGTLLTARWPGDAHRFARELVSLLG